MREQHDHHCVMNVDGQAWRIQWVHNGEMGLLYDGMLQIAGLSKIDWVDYCDNVYAFLLGEQARLRAQERREYTAWRRAIEATKERHVDTGESFCFATADDLEDEVVLVDLEFTDPHPILAAHLERLTA
jgi:hypothetical protein